MVKGLRKVCMDKTCCYRKYECDFKITCGEMVYVNSKGKAIKNPKTEDEGIFVGICAESTSGNYVIAETGQIEGFVIHLTNYDVLRSDVYAIDADRIIILVKPKIAVDCDLRKMMFSIRDNYTPVPKKYMGKVFNYEPETQIILIDIERT